MQGDGVPASHVTRQKPESTYDSWAWAPERREPCGRKAPKVTHLGPGVFVQCSVLLQLATRRGGHTQRWPHAELVTCRAGRHGRYSTEH